MTNDLSPMTKTFVMFACIGMDTIFFNRGERAPLKNAIFENKEF
jgi:hypothetical protein